MALRGTVTDSYFIETKQQSSEEVIGVFFGTPTTYRRIRTIIDGEWIALTEVAARAYVDTHAGDTDTTLEAVEDNRYCGSWKVTKHFETKTQWSADT